MKRKGKITQKCVDGKANTPVKLPLGTEFKEKYNEV